MLRFAREADLPEMLEIYAPYVPPRRNSAVGSPNTPSSFPGWSGRKGIGFWATPTPAPPSPGRPISGAPSQPSICAKKPRARTLPGSSTPCWRKSSFPRAIGCSTAWSAGKIYRPSAFTRKTAIASGRNFPGRALSRGAGWICYGWKNGRK